MTLFLAWYTDKTDNCCVTCNHWLALLYDWRYWWMTWLSQQRTSDVDGPRTHRSHSRTRLKSFSFFYLVNSKLGVNCSLQLKLFVPVSFEVDGVDQNQHGGAVQHAWSQQLCDFTWWHGEWKPSLMILIISWLLHNKRFYQGWDTLSCNIPVIGKFTHVQMSWNLPWVFVSTQLLMLTLASSTLVLKSTVSRLAL